MQQSKHKYRFMLALNCIVIFDVFRFYETRLLDAELFSQNLFYNNPVIVKLLKYV